MSATAHPLILMLSESSVPWAHRAAMLCDLLKNITPETEPLIRQILDQISAQSGESLFLDKAKKLEVLLKEIQEGPMRLGRFIEMLTGTAHDARKGLVVLDDGTSVYAALADEALSQKLRLGDRVVLDGKARVVTHLAREGLKVGEEARLERAIDDKHIEVTTRGDERSVVLAPESLMQQIRAGKVTPGAHIVLNTRQGIAVSALPPKEGAAHFRYLETGPVPDVVVERDIGAPPKVITEVADHIRQEMTRPEVRRGYRLRRCLMKLLCGVSGSGKTLALQAIHRQAYQVMSEVTGVGVDQLPPRVIRFRSSQLLSMWLGESDKNIENLFDSIESLAAEPFTAPDGRVFFLPLLVKIEEADGLGRERNQGQDAVYDRILTTMLQRLDPNREGLRDKLVVFLATTNQPQIVDPAFLRRVGGTTEMFGRLKRSAFQAVLQKHVTGLPAASNNGCTPAEIWSRRTRALCAWLFGPNSDPGVVEITYAGATAPVIKYRRDFLTGALVDRAVQQAAMEACEQEFRTGTRHGITLEQLMRAFNDQILSVVAQLREQNAGSYVDLPDSVRVASVRRIPQPKHLPIEFLRDSPH